RHTRSYGDWSSDVCSSDLDGVAERRTVARLNGKDAIIVEVVKQPGSNTVNVADQVKQALTRLTPELGSNFKASLLIDQSALIRRSEEHTSELQSPYDLVCR